MEEVESYKVLASLGGDWQFWLLAAFVIFLVGLSKGGFGGGLGALAVPLLTLKIDPRLAAALLLPILCAMDFVSVYKFRGSWNKRLVLLLTLPAMLGIGIGLWSFETMDVHLIKLMVGSIAILFVFYYLWGKAKIEAESSRNQADSKLAINSKTSPEPSDDVASNRSPKEIQHKGSSRDGIREAETRRFQGIAGVFWGTLSGFSSYIAHAGGPPAAIFLLGQKLDKTTFVATTVLAFTLINLVKLVPYSASGLLDLSILGYSLYLLPVAPLGVLVGVYLHNRVSSRVFFLVCYCLLFAAGIKLIFDAAKGLWGA